MRTPDDTPLRDGTRDRTIGLLTQRCVLEASIIDGGLQGTLPFLCELSLAFSLGVPGTVPFLRDQIKNVSGV